MLFCDIGNTSYHFFDGKKTFKKSSKNFDPSTITEQVFYICVHVEIQQKLKQLQNWKNLALHVDKKEFYDTMGIDRIVASLSVENGVIVDVGSAITVDIVKNNKFQGGFIYPGINAMQNCFKGISKALDYPFNFKLNLDTLPKNSQDSISYGYIKGLIVEINSYNLPIILTGGDAKKFQPFLDNSIVDDMLIFKGMQIVYNQTPFFKK